ncbi:pyruvate formate lyase family protein, partial [Vibrio parahaemolyticus V-223/04]
CTKMSVSVAKS